MTLRRARDGAVLVLTLARPERRNALDPELRKALRAALDEAARDEAVHAIVLAGEGPVFCAGSDLDALAAGDSTTVLREEYAPLIAGIRAAPKPVIAAVEGVAAGAGAALALAADLVVASRTARFDMAFVRLGLMPDAGLAWHLTRRLGRWRAADLLWRGRPLSAEEAVIAGLVAEATEPGEALSRAMALAAELVVGPARAIAASKSVLAAAETDDLAGSMEREAVLQGELRRTADHAEGMAAFRARRPPRFTGS